MLQAIAPPDGGDDPPFRPPNAPFVYGIQHTTTSDSITVTWSVNFDDRYPSYEHYQKIELDTGFERKRWNYGQAEDGTYQWTFEGVSPGFHTYTISARSRVRVGDPPDIWWEYSPLIVKGPYDAPIGELPPPPIISGVQATPNDVDVTVTIQWDIDWGTASPPITGYQVDFYWGPDDTFTGESPKKTFTHAGPSYQWEGIYGWDHWDLIPGTWYYKIKAKSTNELGSSAATTVGPYSVTVAPQWEYDHIDEEMLAFINLPELQSHSAVNGIVRGCRIAIIDTGLDPDVYDYIKGDGDPARQYLDVKYYDCRTSPITDITNSPTLWNDGESHGSQVFSVATQIARGAEYLIYDVSDTQSINPENLLRALEHIKSNNVDANPDEDLVLSMSWHLDIIEDAEYITPIKERLQDLVDTGVFCVAAKGNFPLKLRNEITNPASDLQDLAPELTYPADFDWGNVVLAAGACFDNSEVDSQAFGQRVNYYRMYYYTDAQVLWGSNYGNTLEIVAPAYHITALEFSSDGHSNSPSDIQLAPFSQTSCATPIVAASAAVIKHYYYIFHQSYPSASDTASFLRESAELATQPTPNQNDENPEEWTEERGYGILDVFDAFLVSRDEL